MIYTVHYTSWENIDFYKHVNDLNQARNNYNTVSIHAKNPKMILSIKVICDNEIEIKFYSKKVLSSGREANALWLFSHDLVKNQGLGIYLTAKGKLLKAA